MDCSRADEYFMKYMDNTLTESEARKLHAHLTTCKKCKEDFLIYESIVLEFTKAELIDAPENLEACVMAEVKKLPPAHTLVNKSVNLLLSFIFVSFFGSLAVASVLFINRDLIFEFMLSSPRLAPYANALSPVSDFVTELTSNILAVLTDAGALVLAVVNDYKYIVLTIAALLLIVQTAIFSIDKSKGGTEAEE